MPRPFLVLLGTVIVVLASSALPGTAHTRSYRALYESRMHQTVAGFDELISAIEGADMTDTARTAHIRSALYRARTCMKAIDIWTRYLDPLAHKLVNGPLPVEWETEVFEKYEKPYRREGAGLMLAEQFLDEPGANSDSLLRLVQAGRVALAAYMADSTTALLDRPDHFFLCQRLFILNLAAIYTTGFECPNGSRVIPELLDMLTATDELLEAFNDAFPGTPVPQGYMQRFQAMIAFVRDQPADPSRFDHFTFIRAHVAPMFSLQQELIRAYGVRSTSWMDYALNNQARSLFAKDLYTGQDAMGVYRRTTDPARIAELQRLGKLLYFDPILSGNKERSCASCHEPGMCFADTTRARPISFDHAGVLDRNAPSLVNAGLNHLLMQDGEHISLQAQARAVITDPREMGGLASEVLHDVLSCPDYRKAFETLLPETPQFTEVKLDHMLSALTIYYTRFSTYRSPFDAAMEDALPIDEDVRAGFNLFMGKAQCATCHFIPQFNGVKPPYISSEFEVIGVPEDNTYASLSPDAGRYLINPAPETDHAFRTGSLRNIARSAPYMHNGAFATLREVIDLYDQGGGAGHGLAVPNQTLSPDHLHLTEAEKQQLEAFMRSLNEDIPPEPAPTALPRSTNKRLNSRIVGGTY